jgi:hypothetical protein
MGAGVGELTSPGVPGPAGAVAADAAANPPKAIAMVRRGGVVPDDAFLVEVLKAELPDAITRRLPRLAFAQRTWWDSDAAIATGAIEIARRMHDHLGIDPAKTTHHVVYGPGRAKMLLLLLRQ